MNTIVNVCHESSFLRRILREHRLRSSAVKMEITRLRQDIGRTLEAIGASYTGEHFLPLVPHGTQLYSLAGNRRLIHVPVAALPSCDQVYCSKIPVDSLDLPV